MIPRDVSYSVLFTEASRGIKRMLTVRLSKKVSESTLRAIALELKARDSRDYKRTFIAYYLPGMTVGAGAWATTHFDPDLNVRILGLTLEQEERLVAEPSPASVEVIGRWLDESPFLGARITIFREKSKLFIQRNFKDGSVLKQELVERRTQRGRRFDPVQRESAGDHWVLRSNGNLETRDREGLISTAKKID